MKVKIKPKKQTIAALRQDISQAGNCRNCHYHVWKKYRFEKLNNKKSTDECFDEPKQPIISDYCQLYKSSAQDVKTKCKGKWIYEHE